MVNEGGSGGRQVAPAVARAVRAIQRLAAAGEPCQLSALSRGLGVGPSSLLTILAPLRDAGVVLRDDAGRYTLGPTLVGLGEAAARACGAARVFERAADSLVEQTGETALLWTACDAGLTLAAVREGRHPLRYVPPVGLRLDNLARQPANFSGSDALVERELLPDVWMIAAPLTSPEGSVTAAVALAGPTARLSGAAGERARDVLRVLQADLAHGVSGGVASGKQSRQVPDEARVPLAADGDPPGHGTADSMTTAAAGRVSRAGAASRSAAERPVADWELAGPIDGAELDAFLRQSHVATLSYVADDGYPATVPLWYAWDGTAFWLAPRPGAEWAEHVRLDPRVSIAVSESTPPLRRVLARGQLVAVDDPSGRRAREVAADLAARYAGCGAARPGDAVDGPVLRLLPERLIAWRGLLRHPRVAAEPTGVEGYPAHRHLG